MSWIAVGGAAISVVGGYMANKSANKGAQAGANAQTQMDLLGLQNQQNQFNITRQDNMPWLQNGGWAMNQLKDLNSGNYGSLFSSPDYTAARDMGLQGIDRGASQRGAMFSGGADADRIKFAGDLATQTLGNYRNSLQSMAGLGQNTAGNLGSLGMGMANNMQQGFNNMGNARNSSFQQQGQNNADFYAGAGGALNNVFQNWMSQRKPSSSGGGFNPGQSY